MKRKPDEFYHLANIQDALSSSCFSHKRDNKASKSTALIKNILDM